MRTRIRPSNTLLALGIALGIAGPAAESGAVPTRNVQQFAHFNDYAPVPGNFGYSSCWSYVHSDGREYAVIGTVSGTAIYNVTNPGSSYAVGFVPGPSSIWREMKSYRDWVYVVTEGPGGAGQPAAGVQIIRMTNPEAPVLAATYAVNFNTSHTVSVDTTRALLICNGTRFWSGGSGFARGMRVLSLASPEAPVEVGWWPGGALPTATAQYVHDSVPIGNRLYASSVYAGIQRVLDLSDPAAPVEISSWTYAGAYYPHNSWPDASGNYLYVTDEQNGQTLRVFDISTVSSPVLVNQFTPNLQAIVHNAHVVGNELYLANYTEGIRVLDISDPAHPAEYGWADTYPGASGGFNGVWGVAPYFPSGTVIASDINTGLYVFRPVRDYGLVRISLAEESALVSCGVDGACCCSPGPCSCPHALHSGPAGAKVYVTDTGDSATVGADGIVQLALDPGAHTILVRAFGHHDATALVTTSAGSRDTLALTLVPRAVAPFSGVVRSAATTLPLEQAEVILAYGPLHDHTDAAGAFALDAVPEDAYRVEVRRPGYVPKIALRPLGPGHESEDFELDPATVWNPVESSAGWVIGAPGESPTIPGRWVFGDPIGTGVYAPSAPNAVAERAAAARRVELESDPGRAGFEPLHEGHTDTGATPAGPVQPGDDRTPGTGVNCFFTGQATDSINIYATDVDAGKTSLTTPAFDVSLLADPVIGWWQWFYSEFGAEEDWFAVLISNDGANWFPVDTTRRTRGHWVERSVRVSDYVAPTNQVRLRFVAADFGTESAVEAAVDDLTLYEGQITLTRVPQALPTTRLAFRAPVPNPSEGAVRLSLDVPAHADVRVEILDVGGRRIRTLHRGPAGDASLHLTWDGADDRGALVPAGRYFARATAQGRRAETTLVRTR